VLEHCKELGKKHPNHNIGIITPYQKQVQYLRELLNKSGLDKVECGTVDGYQGREKDIILFSTVRANNPSNTIG